MTASRCCWSTEINNWHVNPPWTSSEMERCVAETRLEQWGGHPLPFCVSVGGKGLAGEWPVCRGSKGLRGIWGLDGEARVPTLREKRSGRAEMETQRRAS